MQLCISYPKVLLALLFLDRKVSLFWCKGSNQHSCATQVFGVQPDRQSSFWAWLAEGFLERFGLEMIEQGDEQRTLSTTYSLSGLWLGIQLGQLES